MPVRPVFRRRRRARPVLAGFRTPNLSNPQKLFLSFLIALVIFLIIVAPMRGFFGSAIGKLATASAREKVTVAVNDEINRKISEGDFGYNYFVSLEKDSAGNISALTTNMSNVNGFSADFVSSMVKASNTGAFDVRISLGSLTGSSLFAGRGPQIPIRIVMLSSSFVDYTNEFSSAGINQTKHAIKLVFSADVEVFVPWDTIATTVVAEVLVAETIIVGKVPDTYLNMG